MIKIAHEAPLSIIEKVKKMTDYDYALVHLFEDKEIGQQYLDFFKESIKEGRMVLLDNSIFELGESFDPQKFYKWCKILKPTEYIIPDSLNNVKETIKKGEEWLYRYGDLLISTPIGVVQGNTYEEIVECYKFWDENDVKIAFSFDYPFLETLGDQSLNKEGRFATGRIYLIDQLLKDKVINEDRKHHLLGCFLPQEFESYKDFKFIDSLDTSNPVVHGVLGIEYFEGCLNEKFSKPLYTMITDEVDDYQWSVVEKNIQEFRANIEG